MTRVIGILFVLALVIAGAPRHAAPAQEASCFTINDHPCELVPHDMTNGTMLFQQLAAPTAVTFSGPKGPVTIDFKDLSVDMHDNTPPEAARAFWNAVMTVVHKPPLFPEGMPK